MNLAAQRRPLAPLWIFVLCAVVVTAALYAMGEPNAPFSQLLKAYQPREFCMLYEPGVIWLHVISDACIALAYYSIPIALIYFVRKRPDVTFSWIFVCFAVFILACGTTHVMNIIAIWYAPYRLDGIIKLFTALVSIATAGMLWPLLPKALAIPSPEALHAANSELAREVEVRREAEESLRTMQGQLEKHVEERMVELRDAYAKLQAEMSARNAAEQDRESLLSSEREARAEAERANRIKDEFLATLSHELRTPIGAITNWVHLLRTGTNSAAELDEGLAVIDRNARAQASLIDDLLDTSRIISGKMRLQQRPVELAPVLLAALETVEPFAAERGVRLEPAAFNLELVVLGDSGRLQQVVWNLLTNAIKFTPRGGRVTLQSAEAHGGIEIEITDSGAGIPAEFLPKLFERFRQADSSTTRRHGGLGLGLAIVREIVALHGGTVRASSDGKDRGSKFVIWLPNPPLSPDDLVVAHASSPSSLPTLSNARLHGSTILLVEDEPDSRFSLQRLLELHGAQVFTAESAREALELLPKHRPALLVSDIGMPDEDGYSLIRRVRSLADPVLKQIPALALTAFARDSDRDRALGAGFHKHLSKPVDPADLVNALVSLRRG